MSERAEVMAIAALGKLGFEAARDTDPQEELLRLVALHAQRVNALAFQYGQTYSELQALQDPGADGDQRAYRATRRRLEDTLRYIGAQYDEQIYRAAKVAKGAIDAGVSRRRVELAERQGAAVFSVVDAVLRQLGLGEGQVLQARQIIAGEFRRIAEEELA